jgi:SnoaL-like domain
VPKTMHAGDDRETRASTAENEIRAALSQHWAASDANDFATEHQIYRDDAILDYPQSGERIRGRANIQTTRLLEPSTKRFKIHRIVGSGNVWITEYVIFYGDKPFHTVSIMEFRDGKVARETQYFGEPFEASAWRAQFVERTET